VAEQLVEVAYQALCKSGEELCGDQVKISRSQDRLIVAMSDGLGSGVKANILATLTAEIGVSMLEQGVPIEEVLDTLAATLPECKVRRLAYATFTLLNIVDGRHAYLVNLDNPNLFLVRDREVVQLPLRERTVHDRAISEAEFELEIGDYLVMVSDGYIHAGVGGLYRLGWGWKNIATSIKRWTDTGGDAYQLVDALSRTCEKLYNGKPGDDATAVAMKVRAPNEAVVFTGPPSTATKDEPTVRSFMEAKGQKVICGGTTAQIAARVLDTKLEVVWQRYSDNSAEKIPPVAQLKGVDLVTEGIITLSKAAERIDAVTLASQLPHRNDGATLLARILLNADRIHFIVGDAINPQQIADVVRGTPMRQLLLESLIKKLEARGKLITVEHV
jgi:hypothetical protein